MQGTGRRWAALAAVGLLAMAWLRLSGDDEPRVAVDGAGELAAAKQPAPRPALEPAMEVPRWLVETEYALAGEERLRDNAMRRFELSDGLHGLFYPSRPRYPAGSRVDLVLDLTDADGMPATGERGFAAQLLSETERASLLHFVEDEATPGRYRTYAPPLAGDSEVARFALFSHRIGSGQLVGEPLLVEVAAPVRFAGRPRGQQVGDDYRVTVVVVALEQMRGAVRAELQDAEGTSYGEVVAHAPLRTGRNEIELNFGPVGVVGEPPLKLAHAAVLAGDPMTWSDFWPAPVVVAPM